jgi:hypothetical protein
MANETLFTDILTRLRPGYKVGGTVGSTPETKKLIELLNEIKPGDSFNQSDLARKSGASRKLVGEYLKKLYPKLGSGTGRTEKDYSKFKQKVEARDQKVLDKGFLEDYKKKVQSAKGYADSSLSNKALAKKYYPELTETAGIARLEKLARKIRKENPKLIYKKTSPKEFEQRRKSRLLLTQGGKQFGGTDKFPFHHIMPIGGAETDITTKDVTFISKKMNSKLAPFNKKLNGIADGISNNLANYASTKDNKFLKRVDNLNAQALQIVDKTKKQLPKKFQGLIGFNKVTPILDENATLINTSVERIGINEAKSIVGKKGPKIPLKDLSGTRSKSALLSRIKNVGKAVARPVLRAAAPIIPFAGPAIMAMGAADVAEAAEKGAIGLDESPVAYYLGPEAAVGLMNLKARAQRGELPDLADETDFTSFRNGGIVAVKGVN